MKRKQVKRNKAFLGALIGAAASLIGGIGSSLIGSSSQKKAQKKQEEEQYKSRNFTTAANLANSINSSQEAVDDYYNRIGLYKYGGRRRAAWGASDTKAVISGVGNMINSIGSSAVQSGIGTGTQIIQPAAEQFKNKVYKPVSYDSPTLYDTLMNRRMRCGGRMKRRR